MPAYPTLPTKYGDSSSTDQGRRIQRAANGKLRGRIAYISTKRTFAITHEALSADNLATFKAFYEANKAGTFDYTDIETGITYTVGITKDPTYKQIFHGWTDVMLELGEV